MKEFVSKLMTEIPAFAGMTCFFYSQTCFSYSQQSRHSRDSGVIPAKDRHVIPAKAGISNTTNFASDQHDKLHSNNIAPK